MKSTFLKFLKWFGIVIGVMAVFGFVLQIVDPEGVKRRDEERKARQGQRADAAPEKNKTQPAKESKVDPVFQHGFAVGFTSAKSGAVKPTADELDAHARRAAMHLGEKGGMGFKMQWKNGFWAGWAKGD